MKECRTCKKLLDEKEFYIRWRKNGKTYHFNICKVCKTQYQIERMRQLKIKCVEHMGGKCYDCGLVTHPLVYDFHHIKDKNKEISNLKSWKTMEKELQNCVMLCANCHRLRHVPDANEKGPGI